MFLEGKGRGWWFGCRWSEGEIEDGGFNAEGNSTENAEREGGFFAWDDEPKRGGIPHYVGNDGIFCRKPRMPS